MNLRATFRVGMLSTVCAVSLYIGLRIEDVTQLQELHGAVQAVYGVSAISLLGT